MTRSILTPFIAGILLITSVISSRPADVALYAMSRVLYSIQTNDAAPNVAASFPYWVQGQLRLTPTNNINTFFSSYGPALNGPPYSLYPLIPRSRLIQQGGREYDSPNQTDMIFLATNYVFQVQFKNGTSTNLVLPLPPNNGPATVPHVTNLSAAQTVDPSTGFTLHWDPFTDGTTNDLVEVQIENVSSNVFDSGPLPGGGALDVTATSVTIPANTLSPGRSYLGHLLFEKIICVTNGFAPGYSGYGQDTDFYLSTTGAVPLQLISTVPAPGSVNVPGDLPVSLTFSRPLKRNDYSLNGYKLTNSVTFSLSVDGTVFTLTPNSPWPTNLVTYHLNPVGFSPSFSDTNGSPLMSDTFATSFAAGTNLLANPPVSPCLEILGPPTNGTVQLRLTGESYRSYQLQASSDLVNWNSLNTILFTNTQVIFTDTASPAPTNRLYRAQVAQ